MVPYERFNKTFFVKTDSEYEKQIEALERLDDVFPGIEGLNKKKSFCQFGLRGEKEIETELKNADVGMYVLHNVNIEVEGVRTMIDYVVITPGYTYFIECKNLIGNISVNNRGEFTRFYNYKGKNVCENINSSYGCGQRHVEVFRKAWNYYNTGSVVKNNKYQNLNNKFKFLVVMPNSKSGLDLRNAPAEIKARVIKSNILVNYIKRDLQNYNRNFLSGQKEMAGLAKLIGEKYNKNVNVDYYDFYRKKIVGSGDKIERIYK